MFQLVFKGQCAPGVEVATARANVAQLFKANEAQLARMFSGERVIIRNKLDAAAARKYQALFAKQGIIVHIEPMHPAAAAPPPAMERNATASSAPTPPPPAQAARDTAAPQSQSASHQPTAHQQRPSPKREPGERLDLAGERAEEVLAGSTLTLDQPGVTLGQPHEVEAPVFEHLEEWSVAPVGETLADDADKPPVAVPDVSHLELLPPGEKR